MGNMGNVSYNTKEIFITYTKVAIRNPIMFIVKQLCHKSRFLRNDTCIIPFAF